MYTSLMLTNINFVLLVLCGESLNLSDSLCFPKVKCCYKKFFIKLNSNIWLKDHSVGALTIAFMTDVCHFSVVLGQIRNNIARHCTGWRTEERPKLYPLVSYLVI
jgi:hypothetical protein